MTSNRLLLLTVFPPPEAFFLVRDQVGKDEEPAIVLLAGEGVRNHFSDSSRTYFLETDLAGRGIVPGEGALSDDEGALLLLSASSVMTFT